MGRPFIMALNCGPQELSEHVRVLVQTMGVTAPSPIAVYS